MRSLFLKIFLGFWLATILIGATLVVLALTQDPREAERARLEESMYATGEKLIQAFEEEGPQGLAQAVEELRSESGTESLLYKGPLGPLSGRPAPRILRRLTRRALESGQMHLRPGAEGIWVAVPMQGSYVLVSRVPHPTKLERIFNPRRLGMHLLVTFIVASIICYLLARSLTAPIKRLRRATRQFADGDLSTRVGNEIRGHDEIADLSRDFDLMAERIESLVTAQKRLHSDISHELRSPLARLNVALELARKQAGEPAAPSLDRIGLEAERLNDMIGELLTLSMLESNVNKVERTQVNLALLLQEIVADADYEAAVSGRSVTIVAQAPLFVEAASDLLRRAIENVVRNAIRHTPGQGASVEVSLTREGNQAVITVRDHGPGVPQKDLGRIFQPFYRLGDARDRQSGGVGLGLAIAKQSLKLHGGEISADNATGGGLSTRMTLPLARG